jgi:hypothetical protein
MPNMRNLKIKLIIRYISRNCKELSVKQEKLKNKNNLKHQLLIRRKKNTINIPLNKNNKRI